MFLNTHDIAANVGDDFPNKLIDFCNSFTKGNNRDHLAELIATALESQPEISEMLKVGEQIDEAKNIPYTISDAIRDPINHIATGLKLKIAIQDSFGIDHTGNIVEQIEEALYAISSIHSTLTFLFPKPPEGIKEILVAIDTLHTDDARDLVIEEQTLTAPA